jgi:hypothetical protein
MEEFKGFHAQFADWFSREEPRENFYQYIAGQMSQLERKSIEPIALNVESTKVRAMQHFLSNVVWEEERILFRYVAADSIYGNSPEFLEAVEKVPEVTYLVALPRDALSWLQDPATMDKTYRYAGEKKTKHILAETEKKPVTFEKIARGTNDYFWYRRTVSEGTKGPVTYEFMKRRVVLCRDGQPDRSVCKTAHKTLGWDTVHS